MVDRVAQMALARKVTVVIYADLETARANPKDNKRLYYVSLGERKGWFWGSKSRQVTSIVARFAKVECGLAYGIVDRKKHNSPLSRVRTLEEENADLRRQLEELRQANGQLATA